VRDAAAARLEHTFQRQKSMREEYEHSLLGTAQDFLLKNPEASVMDLPPRLYEGLKNTGHLAAIQAFAKNGRFDTDPRAWGEVLLMTREELAKMSPDEVYTKYRGRLSDPRLEQVMALVAEAKGEGNESTVEIVSAKERVKAVAIQNGIIPHKERFITKEEATNFSLFSDEVQRRINTESRALPKGKKLSGEEIQRIIEGTLLDRVLLEQSGIDPKVPSFKARGKTNAYVIVDKRKIFLSDISARDRSRYEQFIRSKGYVVSEEAIAMLWAKDNPRK
jgi:hypothetical protein